ncbi:hypothetical protein CJ179_38745 [Rhodococcus sp. ACS1]|uniref:hypothetical protein n=1 Tax=Rhodococcus sp. ACS1 TaxID=2028570 RepID=UPI000BB11FD6|nr:hypothetical protein [Rhodococcus sp. ACS1]PBC38540.1 hypothetical protein CJ179_38745 [Rhodococcus sp. ACS1]
MTNRMKAKGDRYERDLLVISRVNGFPDAARTKAGYERDAGDLHLDPRAGLGTGVIVQAKDVKTPNWTDWLEGLAEQRDEAKAEVAAITWKRSRPGKSPHHLAVMPYEEWLTLLRRAGYGLPLEEQ